MVENMVEASSPSPVLIMGGSTADLDKLIRNEVVD